jgi:hypothetical protein
LSLIGIRLPARRPKVFAQRERGPKPKLAPNVEFVDLDREAARFGSLTPPGVLSLVFVLAVYLALAVAVAIPVLTTSLWTEALFWGALGATVPLILFHTGRRLSWIRPLAWAVPALALLELANVLLGVGPGVPTGNPAALPAAVVVLTGAVALAWWAAGRRESLPAYAPWYSDLDVRSGAYTLGLAGITLAGCALFLGSNGDSEPASQVVSKALAAGGLVIVPVIGRRVRGARDAARREWARERKVPDVLLLRSFVDDGLRVRSRPLKRRGIEMLIPARRELFEDVVVRAFEVLGPVVAIARPGTRQTELGAARDLILVPDWLTAVRAEMASAAYIVAILGRGEGLERELETLKELKLLDRVCLLVPPIATDDAAERLRRATAAVDGDAGWGRLESSSIDDPSEEQAGTVQVLALLGAGRRRFLVTCRERDAAATYLQLGAILASKDRLGATGRG